jgi:hypothetical protein
LLVFSICNALYDKAFVHESVQVGLSLVCKIFMKEACQLTDGEVKPHPRRALQRFDDKTVCCMVELLCLLQAGHEKPGQQFNGTFVVKQVKKVKTKLTLKKVEDNMCGAEDEPVHEMCHTLQQALAPGESLAEMAMTGEVPGAGTDDDNIDNEVGELDKEAAAVAIHEVDDDAQCVLRQVMLMKRRLLRRRLREILRLWLVR